MSISKKESSDSFLSPDMSEKSIEELLEEVDRNQEAKDSVNKSSRLKKKITQKYPELFNVSEEQVEDPNYWINL